jgi:FKBP-type peptidyl-prolyl cis-trans isomerase
MQQKQSELSATNSKVSDEFLKKNKKRPEVKTTSSGLQYIQIKKGKGPKPVQTDSVKVSYKGMLLDSTVFDSTTSSSPAILDLNRIIPGLAEGLQLMNVGSKYRFFVPPDLGYGMQGAPPAIPPNSVLIFDITLEDIIGKEMKSKL